MTEPWETDDRLLELTMQVKELSMDKHSLVSPEEFGVMAEKFLKEG